MNEMTTVIVRRQAGEQPVSYEFSRRDHWFVEMVCDAIVNTASPTERAAIAADLMRRLLIDGADGAIGIIRDVMIYDSGSASVVRGLAEIINDYDESISVHESQGREIANARLIAAAPSLLAACKAAADVWERGHVDRGWEDEENWIDATKDLLDKVIDAASCSKTCSKPENDDDASDVNP